MTGPILAEVIEVDIRLSALEALKPLGAEQILRAVRRVGAARKAFAEASEELAEATRWNRELLREISALLRARG